MFNQIFQHFMKKMRCKRGSWAATITAVGSVAGGYLSGMNAGKGGGLQLIPDYAETTAGRELWWKKLQEWSTQPGYGAIAPDWADIWKQAQDKVRTYYQGTITSPVGAYSKLKSAAARGGNLNQPGYLRSMSRLQTQEAKDYQDLASTEAINKASFSEQGRKDWLTSLTNIANLKQNAVGGGSSTQIPYGVGNAVADVSGAVGSAMLSADQRSWYEKLLQKYGNKDINANSFAPLVGSGVADKSMSGFGGLSDSGYMNSKTWDINSW